MTLTWIFHAAEQKSKGESKGGGGGEGGSLGIPDPQVLDASSIRVLILNSFNDEIAHHYLTRT